MIFLMEMSKIQPPPPFSLLQCNYQVYLKNMQELTNSYHWKLTPLPRITSTMNKYMDKT